MDDQRVGGAFRAVRIKRGWTQKELGRRAHVSASCVSLIERGHLEVVSTKRLRRVGAALEIQLSLAVRLRHGELERLLNAGHAALHEALARYLDQLPGWLQAPEVSFAIYSERGVIDILALHEPTGSLLVIELKTEVVAIEDVLMTMDVRMRHAARIARDRGWRASSVSAWLVIADSSTNRRRVRDHRSVLRSAFPSDGRRVREWLRGPTGTVRALSFWSDSNGMTATRKAVATRRVRTLKSPAASDQIRTDPAA